jgi:HK97 family phage portal protein
MLGRLLGLGEQRAISYQSLFAAGADIAPRTPAGTVINQETALKVGAVYAAVRLLSDTVSTLPADTYIRQDGQRRPFRPKPMWVDNPDSGTTREDHVAQVMMSLLLDGNAFVRVYRSTAGRNAGLVTALVVLDPTKVEVRRRADGEVEFVFDDRITIAREDMLHIAEIKRPGALRGISRIEQVKDTLGIAAAMDEFAGRFFGQGSVTSGILETPSMLTKEQAMQLKETFEATHRGVSKSHRIGILGGGAKFVKTGVDPESAQMLESRRFAVEEVARVFRIPQHMLQVAAPGVQSYASNEENAIQFATYTLRPYVAKLEAAYSRLLPGDAFMRWNMDGLLRGDLQSRYSAYSTALQSGFMSINDVRRLEDQRAVDGGDAYRVPLANVNVEAANITEQEKRVMMLTRLVQLGFEPSESLSAVGLPTIAHTGLPTVQLQNPAVLDPEDPESVYPVRDLDPQEFATAVSDAIRGLPAPVVNVTVPEQPARTRKVQRDAAGNITEIVEE